MFTINIDIDLEENIYSESFLHTGVGRCFSNVADLHTGFGRCCNVAENNYCDDKRFYEIYSFYLYVEDELNSFMGCSIMYAI
jgi:hypothetical protein